MLSDYISWVPLFLHFLFFKKSYLFLAGWIFVAVHRFPLVSASRGSSCCGVQAPGAQASVVAGRGLKSVGSEL